jgi:hypothetical protein
MALVAQGTKEEEIFLIVLLRTFLLTSIFPIVMVILRMLP